MSEPLVTERDISYRRYLLLKYLNAMQLGDDEVALAGVWRSLHDALTGTELPVGFPFRARLIEAVYNRTEDLDGATVEELGKYVGLAPFDARAVLAAFAAIPTDDA